MVLLLVVLLSTGFHRWSSIQVYIIVLITGIDSLQGFRVVGLGGGVGYVFLVIFFLCFVFVQKSLTFFAKQIYI